MTTTISDLIPPLMVAQAAFVLMIVFTLAGAFLAVIPKKIVHNILGLALAMFGITGVYLYLGSQFVAMMQLLIYVGAICMTYIFAIMLSPPLEKELPRRNKLKVITATAVSSIVFIVMVKMILSLKIEPIADATRDWSIKTLGQLLLTRYFLVFELISLLLAIAIIGSIMVASFVRKRN
ncbi:NADH-quinone oxidoreductase subunit J family protein [Desulfobacterium sp. N47]|uniref:NADH-quinone oxidoreductase subunit J family protein n=1 Tax=Desulfobacterium sp. N47 TaxID=3115210 RepID=UPI003CA0B4C3